MLATNTKTGKTSPETATAVMVRRDTDRYDLTIRAGNQTSIIDTTRNHLFWDVTPRQWIKAGALRRGDHLRTPSGASVTVVSGYTAPEAVGWMRDLSVPGGNDHDFYIDVSTTAVLVHNCPTGSSYEGNWSGFWCSGEGPLRAWDTRTGGRLVLETVELG